MTAVVAKFPSDCPCCEGAVSPGDTIRPSVEYPGLWEHADCAESAAQRPSRAVVCTVCHLQRPCDCDDLSPEWTT